MKNFLDEFKKFISNGNVLDMAIGVVIGKAFTDIVNSLVNDLLMPVIGAIIGGLDFSSIAIPLGGDAAILIGNFIQSIINFLLIALVLFIIVKASNKKNNKEQVEEPEVKEDPEDIQLLKSINDELKKLNKKKS